MTKKIFLLLMLSTLLLISCKQETKTPEIDIPNTNVDFGDNNLKAVLLSKYPDMDADKDGQISKVEAEKITRIDFSFDYKEDVPANQKITSLKGIEAFVNLTHLLLKNQFVTDATPIQNLTKLKVLHLGANELSAIDVSKMSELDSLFLFGNMNITSLDLSKNKKLREVFLQSMGIKNLDLSQCTNLTKAYINNAGVLETLNIGALAKLERLDAVKQNLTSIVAKDLPSLKELHLNSNKINSITLKNLPELNRLNVYANNLKTIDLSELPKLMFLFVHENSSLDSVDCQHNPILLQAIISQTAIRNMSFAKNNIVRNIEIENCPNLKTIDLQNDNFSDEAEYLIKEGNSALTTVYADAGDEFNMIKNIFNSIPAVTVVTR